MGINLNGTGVALVTPFGEDLSVDYLALAKLVEHVSNGGVDYLVVMGTTAESPTLSEEEKLKVLQFVKSKNKKNLPIVYGLGGNNTMAMVRQFTDFSEEVDAFLVVCPYYNRPSQQGLVLHYQAIADAASHPIVLYNVPKRTGVNMEFETVLTLANHPNIIGIKEASGHDVTQAVRIAQRKPKDFFLISGDDDLILPFMRGGGQGVISVIANALPAQTKKLVDESINGGDEAVALTDDLMPALKLIFAEGNPAGVKALLALNGIGNGKVRLPLVAVSEELKNELKALKMKFE